MVNNEIKKYHQNYDLLKNIFYLIVCDLAMQLAKQYLFWHSLGCKGCHFAATVTIKNAIQVDFTILPRERKKTNSFIIHCTDIQYYAALMAYTCNTIYPPE